MRPTTLTTTPRRQEGIKGFIAPKYHALYLKGTFLWSPYGIGQTIIFLPCGFFFLFSSPNLSGRRLDVRHTCTHGVALVRIWNAGLKPAARGSLINAQDAKSRQKIAICAPSHNFVEQYLCK